MYKSKDLIIGILIFILITSFTRCLTNVIDLIIVNLEISKWISLIIQLLIYIAVLLFVNSSLKGNSLKISFNIKLIVFGALLFFALEKYLARFKTFDYYYMYPNLEIDEARFLVFDLYGYDFGLYNLFYAAALILIAFHMLKKQPEESVIGSVV